MGGSYGYNGSDSGNSYMYYDPRYEQSQTYSMARGYSRHGSSKPEMVEELKQMMEGTNDPAIKAAISEAILKMNN